MGTDNPATVTLLNPWPDILSLVELAGIAARRSRRDNFPPRDTRPLLEILKAHVALDDSLIESALRNQQTQTSKPEAIGKILLTMGAIDPESLTRVLCLQHGFLMVDLEKMQTPAELLKQIPPEVSAACRAVPIAVLGGTLFLGVEDPLNFTHREYISFLCKFKIELVMVSEKQLARRLGGSERTLSSSANEFQSLAKEALNQSTGTLTNDDESSDDLASQIDASIVGLVNKIIYDAADMGASDIHLECFPGVPLAQIRFRRDGILKKYSEYTASYHRAVVSRIKIMASLNIAESRFGQDGKITFARPGKSRIDLRVATIPTARGIENVTIRLLHGGEPIPLDKLELAERDLTVLRRIASRPHGLVLVCGPTGSGKTTTLHSVLRELNTPETKIWTAEDPIEIVQKNICQVQVNTRIGWTFAMVLRSFLRADPDVIMVGEMRDAETAGIAVEAAMTGHLVLSTLHTNSAAETTTRLLDLGIDPFNLADALLGIVAQRLARRLCTACAEKEVLGKTALAELASEYHFSARQLMPTPAEQEVIIARWQKQLGPDPIGIWHPRGCDKCNGDGYKGRISFIELLEVSPQVREAISHRNTAARTQQIAVAEGMQTLKQDGIEKALRGLTDMSQVRSVCV